uniref:Uncharacterized protein n=1 Tax=Rhizophora mucronata TaxID=61149 RepID=A0A2P2NA89_RHIMU
MAYLLDLFYSGFQIFCMDSSFLPFERQTQVVTLSLPICFFSGIFPLEHKAFIRDFV